MRIAIVSGLAHAIAILAAALWRTIWARAFSRPTGLPIFNQNYAEDRLVPMTSAERKRLPTFSGCIACGRCDRGEGTAIARSGGAYPGPMALVLASARSMPDYDAARRGFDHMSEATLAEKERICPVGIQFRDLAAFVRTKADEMGR